MEPWTKLEHKDQLESIWVDTDFQKKGFLEDENYP